MKVRKKTTDEENPTVQERKLIQEGHHGVALKVHEALDLQTRSNFSVNEKAVLYIHVHVES
jgi:hypothetical protein